MTTGRSLSLALLALVGTVAACADDAGDAGDAEVLGATTVASVETEPPTVTEPTVAGEATIATELAPAAVLRTDRPVGRSDRTVVDPTRPTVAVEGVTDAAPDRTIPTIVLYPAESGDPAQATADAAPATDGPFPLVVVNHGLTGRAEQLLPLLTRIAAAGYVVASPDFPETTGGDGFEALTRYVDQPGDVAAVIDAVLADPVLGPLADADRLAVGGHSLGGLTTFGIAFHDCCRDPRVDAAFTLAAPDLAYPEGSYDWSRVPLLLVHGEDDPLVGYETSQRVLAAATTPAYLLTLVDEDHSAGLAPEDPGHEAVGEVVVAFLDRWLRDDVRAESTLTEAADLPGIAVLTSR